LKGELIRGYLQEMFTRNENVNLDFSKATTYIFLFTEKSFMHSIRSTNDREIGWLISIYI